MLLSHLRLMGRWLVRALESPSACSPLLPIRGSARAPARRAAEWVAAPERVPAEAWHSSSDACHAARSASLNPDCAAAAAAAAASVLRLEWVLLLGA